MRKQNQNKRLGMLLAAVLVVAAAAIFSFAQRGQEVSIPKEMQQRLTFQPILPDKKSATYGDVRIKVDEKSIQFNPNEEILSYAVQAGDTTITITQQAYPEVLLFDKLVGSMGQYDEMQTKLGKVALTRPSSTGRQVAVLMSSGTSGVLLFAKTEKDLEKSQWHALFNALRVRSE